MMMLPVEPRGAVQASAATSGPSQELFRPLFEERERERTKDQRRGSGQSLYWGVRQAMDPLFLCYDDDDSHGTPQQPNSERLRRPLGLAWHVPRLLLTCCRRPDQTDRPKAYPSGSGDRGPDPWMQD